MAGKLSVFILNSDPVENRAVGNFLSVRLQAETTSFELESEATEWLKKRQEQVDIVFLSAEAVRGNPELLNQVRTSTASQFATVFLLASAEDKEWMSVVASTGEVVDNMLIKPYRVTELIERTKKAMRSSMVKAPSLLIIEKEADDRELLRESLSMLGFANVYESKEALDALDLLNSKPHEIGVVVSSWELDGMTGIQLLKKIRQNPKTAMLSFVMVASQTSIEQAKVMHTAESGIQGYLVKPFDPKTFPADMEKVIERIDKGHKVGQFLRETKVFETRGVASHAIDLLTHAIKTLPDAAPIYEALGDVYKMSSQSSTDKNLLAQALTQAVDAYEKALKIEPTRATVVSKCVSALQDLGRVKDVVRVTKGYLYRFGFDDHLRTQLGKIYLQSGDYGAAYVELRRALSVNPFNSEAQTLLQVANDLQKGSSKAAA